jgi:hypothetical protein
LREPRVHGVGIAQRHDGWRSSGSRQYFRKPRERIVDRGDTLVEKLLAKKLRLFLIDSRSCHHEVIAAVEEREVKM